MIKNLILLSLLLFSAVNTKAQQPGKPTKNKQAEQNEINADQHLQKELQQKQLGLRPVRLVDSSKQEEIKETKQQTTFKKTKTIKRKNKNGGK